MSDAIPLKEVIVLISVIISILFAISTLFMFIIKQSFARGKTYNLFTTLVNRVGNIEQLLQNKFEDYENQNTENIITLNTHEIRISHLESDKKTASKELYVSNATKRSTDTNNKRSHFYSRAFKKNQYTNDKSILYGLYG